MADALVAPRAARSAVVAGGWRFVATVFVVSRLLVLVSFAIAGALAPTADGTSVMHWDARLYEHLATVGYTEAHLCAMFPGFPLAIRAAMATSLGFLAAATALNAVLCFGVLALTNLLAAETIGSRGARVAVAILAFHPLSFYFSIPYTESLFLSASLGAAIAARRGNWHGAAACGAVAVLTRNSGILLLPALLATPVRGERAVSSATAGAGDWRRRWPLVAMPLALGGWMAFTWARWDDPWLWVTAQRAWRQHLQLAWPFAGYVRDLGRYRAYLDHHLPLTTLGLIGVCFAARSLPRPWLLYAAPATLLSVSLSKLAITPRLQLAVFPIWIAWADWLERHVSKRTLLALGAISALVQAGLVWRYCHDLWVD